MPFRELSSWRGCNPHQIPSVDEEKPSEDRTLLGNLKPFCFPTPKNETRSHLTHIPHFKM
ncbi:hypothetical protein [Baaleninema simplex]|uniref:hypothetical protein n=1 Tax=Baaleninema simplex TaxID=2862350 RepID=UPI00034CF0FE|nr:hypothetical protein [Baaleninema simplex]